MKWIVDTKIVRLAVINGSQGMFYIMHYKQIV